ncbi:hypothetical protein RB195_014240 [Necator americanus]|uniref:GDSL-like protein n=1 Tax=Necator americanus TaxID=51031 RepID=A0ABR1E0S0_NECAM
MKITDSLLTYVKYQYVVPNLVALDPTEKKKMFVKRRKRVPLKCAIRILCIPFATTVLLGFIFYAVGENERPTYENSRSHVIYIQLLKEKLKPSRMKSLGGKFSCDVALMKPSAEVPQDANHVRPADIRHIGAMGDSFAVSSDIVNIGGRNGWLAFLRRSSVLTKGLLSRVERSLPIGLHSTNYDGEMADIFPGNSFFTGADESLSQHVTIANILRELNPQIGGVSYGKGSAKASFNVAVPWTNSEDLPRQAEDLVNRIKMKGRMVWMYEWKLIAIFTGIHDLGFLSCHDDRTQEPTPAWQYKTNIENAIGILRAALNRTIVVLIPILTPRVLIGAEYMIDRIPKPCWLGNVIRDHRDYHVWDLNKMLKKIQYERKFECSGFAVVLQDFVDNVLDPVLNRNEEDQEIFYAHDLFHLSKYGNAVFATHLWNSLLDPVGSAATNFSDTTVTLKCPSEKLPYIRTLDNSF